MDRELTDEKAAHMDNRGEIHGMDHSDLLRTHGDPITFKVTAAEIAGWMKKQLATEEVTNGTPNA